MDLCFNNDNDRDGSCTAHTAPCQTNDGRLQCPPRFNQPRFHCDTDVLCKHEELPHTFFPLFLQGRCTSHSKYFSIKKQSGTDKSLFISFPHSFQGTDPPCLESFRSTSQMDLEEKNKKRRREYCHPLFHSQSREHLLRLSNFHPRTLFDEVEDVVGVEGDFVHILAGVLVQGPTLGPLGSRLRFWSRRRSLGDAPLPLFPMAQEYH